MPYLWALRLWCPHKMITVLRTATMIAILTKNTLFLRTVTMIVILTKWSVVAICIIYEVCGRDRSPHKIVMLLSLYMIATMIAVFLLRLWPWLLYVQIFFIFETLWKLRLWSQLSQNALFFCFVRTVNIVTVFFINTAIMIAVLTKFPISESVLTEDYDHESQPSYQHRHH